MIKRLFVFPAKMKSSSGEDSQKPMSTEEIDGALALELQKKARFKGQTVLGG